MSTARNVSGTEEGGHESSHCQSDLSAVKAVGKASLCVFFLLLTPKINCLLIYIIILTLIFVSASRPISPKKIKSHSLFSANVLSECFSIMFAVILPFLKRFY